MGRSLLVFSISNTNLLSATLLSSGKWRILGLICVTVGMLCNFIFYKGMSDVCENKNARKNDSMKMLTEELLNDALLPPSGLQSIKDDGSDSLPSTSSGKEIITEPFQWLKVPLFYPTAIIYMATRLLINIINVYITFYLIEHLSLPSVSLALVPLVMFCSSFVLTSFGKRITKKLGKPATYILGGGITSVGCVGCFFLKGR